MAKSTRSVISFFFQTQAGRYSRNFVRGYLSLISVSEPRVLLQRLPNDAARNNATNPRRDPLGAKRDVTIISRGQSDVGLALGPGWDELDCHVNWSEYTTGYTTSAEYPSIRVYSRAGPPVE